MLLLVIERAESEAVAQIDLVGAAVLHHRAAAIKRHQPRVACHERQCERIDADHAIAVDEGVERHGHAVVPNHGGHHAPGLPVAHMAKRREVEKARKIAYSIST